MVINSKYQDEVHRLSKLLPQGDWKWPGADNVCSNLQKAASKIALERYGCLSDLHCQTMAVLGCGDEETCKSHQLLLRGYGYID